MCTCMDLQILQYLLGIVPKPDAGSSVPLYVYIIRASPLSVRAAYCYFGANATAADPLMICALFLCAV
jgi:hypothetical protein